jgi:hypothetical protein
MNLKHYSEIMNWRIRPALTDKSVSVLQRHQVFADSKMGAERV